MTTYIDPPIISSLQTKLITLYLQYYQYFPYNNDKTHQNVILDPNTNIETIEEQLPNAWKLFKKSNQNWFETFLNFSKLVSGSRYLRVRSLCHELIQFYHMYRSKYGVCNGKCIDFNQNESYNRNQVPTPLEHISYQFCQQFLHLSTISHETILEFLLKLISIYQINPTNITPDPTDQFNILNDSDFAQYLFSPTSAQPTPSRNASYNLSFFNSLFTTDSFPKSLLLSATLSGQVENVKALLAIPMIDINSRTFLLLSPWKKVSQERIHNALTQPDISKPLVTGVNPATVPYSPNKLLPCPPFPWDSIQSYPALRLLGSNFNTTPPQTSLQAPNSPSQSSSLSLSPPLLHSPSLMHIYYHILNQFGTCLYAASSLINGNSNRTLTKRQILLDSDPVLYADEDSSYYPPAPPSETSPWFFPPSSPTGTDTRSHLRSNASGKSPLIRWCYVAPGGSWRRLEDEEVNQFRQNPETKSSTYMLASSKLPRTLFTDALDLITLFIALGGEVLLPLATVVWDKNGQDQQDPTHTSNYLVPYQTIVPIPITIQETLPNNALTASARFAVRLGLVRYQRWCNQSTNMLLDSFMDTLGFNRIKNRAYHRYNGHHWPYAYMKSDKSRGGENNKNDGQKSLKNGQSIENNLVGRKNGIIRDIKHDNTYQSLFSLIMTTRTTQIKLGIQDVPTPVSYRPTIAQNVSKLVKRYKKVLSQQEAQLRQETPLHSRTKNPLAKNPLTKVANNDDDHDDGYSSGSGGDEGDEGGDEAEGELNSNNISQENLISFSTLPTLSQRQSLAPDFSSLGIEPRTHLPSKYLPKFLNTLQWFFSYHYTNKYFTELAAKSAPNSAASRQKSKKKAEGPTFGGPVACYARRESDRRLAEIEKAQNMVKLQEEIDRMTAVLAQNSTSSNIAPTSSTTLACPEKPQQGKRQAAVKMSQNDIDDIMGTGGSKKKKDKKGVKNAKNTVPVEVDQRNDQIEIVHAKTTPEVAAIAENVSPENNEVKLESGKLNDPAIDGSISTVVGPNFDQELILNPSEFPHLISFNNFYDSDDNLPLFMTLSRYHANNNDKKDDELDDTFVVSQNQPDKSKTQTAAKSSAEKTAESITPVTKPSYTQPSSLIKQMIDSSIISPHFQSSPFVTKLMTDSYENTANSYGIDPFTNLFHNQLVLGSTGYISMEWMTKEEAEKNQTQSNEEKSSQNEQISSSTTPTIMNPIWNSQVGSSDVLTSTATTPASTINMIDNDHFLTREMSHALEMSSTLASLVILYCGQNTHRGYTDLQYAVKIGQPLSLMK